MTAGLRIDHYDWAGGREAMLRFGPDGGPVVIVAPPLFEEANRTRGLIVATLRGIAERGIAGALPDLPGQAESLKPTVDARLMDWRGAFAAAVRHVGQTCYGVAVRGGALIDGDGEMAARLHLSPEPGKSLVRDLLRARRAAAVAAGERPPADDLDQAGPPLLLAGNVLDRELVRELTAAVPGEASRTIRLFPDGGDATLMLAPDEPPNADGDRPRFRTPWTASEPFVDMRLAGQLTADIAAWVARCEG